MGPSDTKELIELFVQQNCVLLTVGQRCADWFVLRQFRVTGTNAAKVLQKNGNLRSIVGLPPLEHNSSELMPKQMLNSLASGWFSNTRSTDELFQVLQQIMVLSFNFGIYVVASETVVIRVVVVRCSAETRKSCW